MGYLKLKTERLPEWFLSLNPKARDEFLRAVFEAVRGWEDAGKILEGKAKFKMVDAKEAVSEEVLGAEEEVRDEAPSVTERGRKLTLDDLSF